MKKILFILMVMAILACTANATSLRQMQVSFVDEFGDPVTTITSITVFNSGLGSSPTIFSDRAGTITVTNPITTGSANSTFDQSLGLVRWFQQKPTYKLTVTDGTKTLTIDAQNEGDTRFPWYDNYIGTAASLSVGDNQSITVGSDSDFVLSWVNASDLMNWIPNVDGVTFNIGSTTVDKQVNFNVFVGGIGGGGLAVDEGASTFGWTGGVFNVNASSDFATNINTGTSTGAVSIGNALSGTWSIDGTAGGTITADDSLVVTVTAGTIGVAATGGDITVDGTNSSVIVRGTESVSDAVLIDADGAAGGVVVQSGTGDITLDSGDDIFLAADTGIGDVISLINTQGTNASAVIVRTVAAGSIDIDSGDNITVNVADDYTLDTADGKITLIADGAGNGDIELNAEDDIILTTTGKVTITNTEAVTISGALTVSGALTMSGGQTRTVFPDVVVDGTVPPSKTAIGTSAQSQIPVWSFDANPDATGDDYVFLLWRVPAGYVVDSADLFFTFSYSTTETDGDDVVFDITVLALTPGSGAAGGTAFDAAGSAVAALDVDLVNGDGDEGKIMEGTFDIEVTAIAAGDEVLIAFWVDESESDLAASGTIDIHKWTITYESTE